LPDRVVAVVGLGSNLGNRQEHLDRAIERLSRHLHTLRVSSVHETDPVGVPGDQPRFLNAVAVGETTHDARALLDELMAIEREAGRERPYAGAARTLDLDLILFGDSIIDEPRLSVPHPRFRERRFVLEPLVEIAPDVRDPITGLTAAELLMSLERPDPGARNR
jgi:2-amino-4-hydroxy-6-hydroxymethyldihydropteridine diphosphokinase